jgi:hypothetical protein
MQSCVTRRGKDGKVWGARQRITVDEAIRCYTRHAAYASFDEGRKGSIEPGKLADLVVLGADPTTTRPGPSRLDPRRAHDGRRPLGLSDKTHRLFCRLLLALEDFLEGRAVFGIHPELEGDAGVRAGAAVVAPELADLGARDEGRGPGGPQVDRLVEVLEHRLPIVPPEEHERPVEARLGGPRLDARGPP